MIYIIASNLTRYVENKGIGSCGRMSLRNFISAENNIIVQTD